MNSWSCLKQWEKKEKKKQGANLAKSRLELECYFNVTKKNIAKIDGNGLSGIIDANLDEFLMCFEHDVRRSLRTLSLENNGKQSASYGWLKGRARTGQNGL